MQRGVRASVAAGLAWQIAVLLPATMSDHAYYAPLGAVIAVHPTVADSAGAAWRTVAAMFLGFGLAVGVYEVTRGVPNAFTIGTDDPAAYVLRYGGLTLLGAVAGVAVTTVLFPPMLLTVAVERIAATRGLVAAHLEDMASALRGGTVPDPDDWARRGTRLDERDSRDDAVDAALGALDRLTHLPRASEVPDDEGFFALGAVTVGVRRSLHVLEARVR